MRMQTFEEREMGDFKGMIKGMAHTGLAELMRDMPLYFIAQY
jgi:hypothetical protein